MQREVGKYLFDIRESIASIEQFLGKKRDFDDYQANKLVRRAVERELGIIGEAINKYCQEGNPELSKSRQIVNFRNRLIHAYDSVDDSVVWAIMKNHLPLLKAEVEELIKQS